MKSIREWMKEKGIVSEDMNKMAFSRFMRGPGDAGTTMSLAHLLPDLFLCGACFGNSALLPTVRFGG